MIHNGIEYGMMQAYAEGFDILHSKSSDELPEDERYTLNLTDVAEVWRRGSVISSWLLDLTAMALAENDTLSNFQGGVADSGEGRWTVEAAIEEAVPAGAVRRRCSPASAAGASTPSPTSCSRPCAPSSAATPRRRSKGLTHGRQRAAAGPARRHGGAGKAAPAPACILVIFGAGDLTRRLLMPSLYNLQLAHLLDDGFQIDRRRPQPETTARATAAR